MTDQEKIVELLGQLEDGIEPATRSAFVRVFGLVEHDILSGLDFRPLHQETRLAIEVWNDDQTRLEVAARLFERDQLAVVRGGEETRIIRMVWPGRVS